MTQKAAKIILRSCPKGWREDLDKAVSPSETCRKVGEALARSQLDVLSELRRVDNGRLGIPVYLSVCGADARRIMPTRKQMGKGSSPEQAQASALMELMERFAFFSFWAEPSRFRKASWSEAKKLFGSSLIPVEEMLASVNDELPPGVAESVLDLHAWSFYPATRLNDGELVWLPLDWFRMLGEFNGSSAGNTQEESLLQGLCELVERHACCLAAKAQAPLPSLDASACGDAKLAGLIEAFKKNGVQLILKDMRMGMGIPTVAALAWDPASFPRGSEIVFTAGTATSPVKAAIRAVTEVAQLAGDFNSNACYEASGLPKYESLEDCAWLLEGPSRPLESLPTVERDDMAEELKACLAALGRPVYAVDATHPLLGIPAHYCVAPGLQFRERASNQSLGLFTGRKLAEERPFHEGMPALERLGRLLPNAPWLPFFKGLAHSRKGDPEKAAAFFKEAIPLQPDQEAKAMAQFYAAYALSQLGDWRGAAPLLEEAVASSPEMKECHNLLGVARYKLGDFAGGERAFTQALRLDKGSAMDLANRGLCRKARGKKAEAAEDLRAALELDPSIGFAAEHLEALLRQ